MRGPPDLDVGIEGHQLPWDTGLVQNCLALPVCFLSVWQVKLWGKADDLEVCIPLSLWLIWPKWQAQYQLQGNMAACVWLQEFTHHMANEN